MATTQRTPAAPIRMIAAAVALAMAGDGFAQFNSPLDPPSQPGPGAAEPPRVRGLYDAAQPPGYPLSAPAGAAGAPPATFVPPATHAAAAPHWPAEDVAPTPIEGAEIIARIDGEVVLASDINWQIDQMVKAVGARVPPNQMAAFRQAMLQRQVLALLDTKLLYADFRRTAPAEALPKVESSLAKPFEDFEVPRLKKLLNVQDRVELDAALRASGSSLKDVQRQFNEKTIAGEWLKQKLPKEIPLERDAILAYYQDHLKEYEFPAQARWEELMVRFDRMGGDRQAAWQALCEMGNEVWQHAARNPAARGPAFAEVAKARSHGFTAAQGGAHEWTTLGALKCEGLNDALATLEVGQMSDGVESEQGFHIVRVLERREAGRVPFTEAQVKIREILTLEQKQSQFEEALAKLRKGARVWTLFDGEMSGEQIETAIRALQKR